MSELRLYAMTCGWLTAPTALFLAGEKGSLRIPVPCYLVDHPQGRVLFNSGMPVAAQTDPEDSLGPAAPFFEVEFRQGEELAARLETLERKHLPGGAIHDRERMLASLEALRKLQRGGARIFCGHDPEFWAAAPQAPVEVQ